MLNSTGSLSIEQLSKMEDWAVVSVERSTKIYKNKSDKELLHNPMMAFWLRAKIFFNSINKLSENGEQYLKVAQTLFISVVVRLNAH